MHLRRRAVALGVLVLLMIGIVDLAQGRGAADDLPTRVRTVFAEREHARAERARMKALAPILERRRESRAIDNVLGYTSYISRGSPRKREVALTFDDGPGPYTPEVLKILRREHAPATFFIVGDSLKDFGVTLRDELADGFVIGNHTQSHMAMGRLTPKEQDIELRQQIAGTRRFGAQYPRLFRPPLGSFSPSTLKLLKRKKMLMVLWSVDTEDYRQPGEQAIINAAVQGAHPGAVILMHDAGGNRSQTVAALPAIIAKIRKRGFKLVTVPQLVKDDPPPRGQPLPRDLSGG
jgi:peptidoglycan-N-acetylglucosamine deacetylase